MAKVTHKIQSVEFGLHSPEDIKRGAVAKIHEPTIYEANGTPRTGGVNDLRMGSVGSHRCSTCWHGMRGCSGHYGYIEFHDPQWHVGWLDVINKLLRCVCFWCSKALLPEEELLRLAVASTACSSYRRKQMVSVISNRSKTRTTCPHCDGPQPLYTRQSGGIELRWPEGTVFASPDEEAFARRALPGHRVPQHPSAHRRRLVLDTGPQPHAVPARVDDPDRPAGAPALHPPRRGRE